MSSPSSRIVSLDQFRGYTVVGMILVNFIGDFQRTHAVFQHHDTYFSYADTIMPAFHFAVGFALRLSLLKRLATQPRAAYLHVVWRCLGLILLSTILEWATGEHRFKTWDELTQKGLWGILAGPLKCEFWETLAIIGVTSLWVLPVIASRVGVRITFMAACALLHVVLSYSFYFDFLWARPNWLDPWWGAADVKGLDGGPLGFLAWCIPQLVGSLAYDAVAKGGKGHGLSRLLAWSVVLMGLGYGLSCLTMRYTVVDTAASSEPKSEVAASPVLPPAGSEKQSLLAQLVEPPFVQPPPPEQRQLNYWMMSKRTASLSLMLFSSGFCLVIYAFFVLLSDWAGLEVGLFRTFGKNALAAYIIHGMVGNAVGSFAPSDSPWWWVSTAFLVYFGITYLFVRSLESKGIYLRM